MVGVHTPNVQLRPELTGMFHRPPFAYRSGKWAGNHLPRVFHARAVVFDESSVIESVERLFKNAKFVNGSYTYERRTLRVIVQERLWPFKSLSNVRDIGQVFLDIARSPCSFCFSIDLPFSSPLVLRLP